MTTTLDAQIEVLLTATTLSHIQSGQERGVQDSETAGYYDRVHQRLQSLQIRYAKILQDTPEAALLEKLLEQTGSREKFFEQPIEVLNLSARPYRALQNERICHIGEVMDLTAVELMYIPNVGKKSLQELKTALGVCHLTLSLSRKIFYIHPTEQAAYLKLFDTPVTQLGLSESLLHTIKKSGAQYVGELVQNVHKESLSYLDESWRIENALKNLHPRLRLGLPRFEYTRPELRK